MITATDNKLPVCSQYDHMWLPSDYVVVDNKAVYRKYDCSVCKRTRLEAVVLATAVKGKVRMLVQVETPEGPRYEYQDIDGVEIKLPPGAGSKL